MSREEVRRSLDYAFEGILALVRNDPLPPPRAGTYRVRIRVPEDYGKDGAERWTALADVFTGQPYDYHTVGFAVEVEFGPDPLEAAAKAVLETTTDRSPDGSGVWQVAPGQGQAFVKAIANLRSSLSAVPGTETEPENAKAAASTAVGRDVR